MRRVVSFQVSFTGRGRTGSAHRAATSSRSDMLGPSSSWQARLSFSAMAALLSSIGGPRHGRERKPYSHHRTFERVEGRVTLLLDLVVESSQPARPRSPSLLQPGPSTVPADAEEDQRGVAGDD